MGGGDSIDRLVVLLAAFRRQYSDSTRIPDDKPRPARGDIGSNDYLHAANRACRFRPAVVSAGKLDGAEFSDVVCGVGIARRGLWNVAPTTCQTGFGRKFKTTAAALCSWRCGYLSYCWWRDGAVYHLSF